MNREASPPRTASWKWWITGLLLLATMINYMDRVTLASAAVQITNEFGLSEKQYGDLESVFGWGFAIGSLLFGLLADRLRVYFLYPVILAGWSMMGIATGWTSGYWGLLACRGLLGLFEAGHWPCAVKTTFALLEEKDRTMGNSILQSGASLGAIITPQIMRHLATDRPGSWRQTFLIIGSVGLVWVIGWFVSLRRRDLDHAAPTTGERSSPKLAPILRSRRFWALAILLIGAQIVWHIYRAWLTKFLQTGRGYSRDDALNFYSLYYVATDIGCICAGVASMALMRKRGLSAHDARRIIYAAACVLTSLCVFIPWLGKGPMLLATLLLIGAGALALFPCYYSFTQELSAKYVGSITGLLSLIGWALPAPMHSLYGKLIDHTKSYDLGFMIAGLAPWIGVISMAALWRKDESLETPALAATPSHAD